MADLEVATAPESHAPEPPAEAAPPSPAGPAGPERARVQLPPLAVRAVLLVALGVAVVGTGYAYRVALTTGARPGGEMAPFAPFWAALLTWVVVAAWVLMRRGSSAFDRSLTILATGFVFAVPKYLRNPDLPLFFDEIAHWGQAQYMESTGRIDRHNVVEILQDYPGLHGMTAALHQVTHLPTWTLASIMLISVRSVLPLLVRDIARSARVPERAADLAALVYALNPGFMYFTGMYAYESFAIVFQIATLALALRVVVTARERAAQIGRLAVLTAAAATVTHHLTSLFMVGILLLLPLAALRSWAVEAVRERLLMVCTAVFALVATWTALNFATVWAYLGVFPQRAAQQFTGLLFGSDRAPGSGAAAGSRGVLHNTGLPGYETVLALLSIPLAVALGGFGLWLLRRRPGSPVVRALAVLALAYPISMPLVLTIAGAPGAHRSWPFSYQGLAVFIGVALAAVGAAGYHGRWAFPRRVAAIGALVVLVVGNCASENHAVLRFPGAFVLGTEGRAQSPELLRTATWSGQELGGTGEVIADYYTGGYVSAFGGAPVASGFPGWDLLFYTGFPKLATVRALQPEHVGFMVVDRRLSTAVFRSGFYVDNSEPLANVRTKPIPAAALTKFEAYPWCQKVWSSTNYDVYRFDMSRLRLPAGEGP